MKKFLGILLVLSLGFNVFVWSRYSAQQNEMKSLQAGAGEAEELRRQSQETSSGRASATPAGASAEAQEIARLRNEVGQLRKQAADAEAQRTRSANEVTQLRSQLAQMTQRLNEKPAAAEGNPMAGDAAEAARQRVQAIQCMNNLKQIGLAARLYANDHNNVFPPDFVTMRNELVTPKILFCPAVPGGAPATDWAQLNPTAISYQFLNPNGNESDPAKPLTTCPIHGHTGFSDGSVQAGKK
jgi:hypothetical protein